MIIKFNDCENLIDLFGNRPKSIMIGFTRLHLGLVKIWFGHQYYNLFDDKNKLVKNLDGTTHVGKHLNSIEIKWAWK